MDQRLRAKGRVIEFIYVSTAVSIIVFWHPLLWNREGFCGAERLIHLQAIQARFSQDQSHADTTCWYHCNADDTNLKTKPQYCNEWCHLLKHPTFAPQCPHCYTYNSFTFTLISMPLLQTSIMKNEKPLAFPDKHSQNHMASTSNSLAPASQPIWHPPLKVFTMLVIHCGLDFHPLIYKPHYYPYLWIIFDLHQVNQSALS